MTEMAELKALREHVGTITKMLFEERDFPVASDTKLRMREADDLIAAGEKGQTDEWRVKATEMAKKLRAECGAMQPPVK